MPERELPGHDEHDDDRADEHERVLHEQHESLRDQLLHRVDVGGHAGDDPARLLGLEEVERQAHHVTEEAVAEIAQEALADARDEDDRDAPEHESGEGDGQVGEHRVVERGRAAVRVVRAGQARVDAVLHEQRPGEQAWRPAPSARAPRRR